MHSHLNSSAIYILRIFIEYVSTLSEASSLFFSKALLKFFSFFAIPGSGFGSETATEPLATAAAAAFFFLFFFLADELVFSAVCTDGLTETAAASMRSTIFGSQVVFLLFLLLLLLLADDESLTLL